MSVITQNENPPQETSRTKLRLFDDTIMKPLGETILRAINGDQAKLLRFQIVKGTSKPLLSADTYRKLRLLKVDQRAEIHSMEDDTYVPLTKDTILREFKDVFKGLGHIGDASFVADATVTPVQHTSKRIPVILQKEVKAMIAELVQKGIIWKETNPT